ncbi:MAG TPA: M90 family metallopeptidase [Gemmataceae bacterium]|nr:M90 family metallopeptidase [Gemmataceae bacterium]
MLFRWWKNRRRRKILAEPFPAAWQAALVRKVGHYHVLSDAERDRLRRAVQIMIAEKTWEGCRGLELTDEMRVTIAALMAILILGFDDFYFDNVETILVYPDEYRVRQESGLGPATIVEDSERLGEAQYRGPVLLAWNDVEEHASFPGYAENLVFHEFAHKLDLLNGAFDGTPNLQSDELAARWARVMNVEWRRLQRAERAHRHTLLDPYGASDPAEFFAVTTECFFDAPHDMREVYPELYELFRDYYRQDPARWPPFIPAS